MRLGAVSLHIFAAINAEQKVHIKGVRLGVFACCQPGGHVQGGWDQC